MTERPDLSFVSLDNCPSGEAHLPKIGRYRKTPCVYCERCQRFFCYLPRNQWPKGEKEPEPELQEERS